MAIPRELKDYVRAIHKRTEAFSYVFVHKGTEALAFGCKIEAEAFSYGYTQKNLSTHWKLKHFLKRQREIEAFSLWGLKHSLMPIHTDTKYFFLPINKGY